MTPIADSSRPSGPSHHRSPLRTLPALAGFASAAAGLTAFPAPAHAVFPDAAAAQKTLTLEVPAVLEHFGARPEGISKNDIHPPIVAGVEFRTLSASKKSGLWGGAHLGKIRTASEPVYGFSFGPLFHGGRASYLFGIEVESNRWISSGSSLGNTVLDNWRWAAVGGIEYRTPALKGTLFVKAVNGTRTSIGDFEGQITQADYDTTWVVSPAAHVSFAPLLARAGFDVYSLGTAAIASKDFAFRFDPQMLIRYHASAGISLGAAEIWLKAALITGVDDGIEHVYRAAFLHNDYLLAPKSAALEVRFSL